MNGDYSEYSTLYTINDDTNNINNSIELNNNNILYITMEDDLKLVNLFKEGNKNEENNEFKDNITVINYELLDIAQKVVSIKRIKENIICLNISKNSIPQCYFRQNDPNNIFDEEELLKWATLPDPDNLDNIDNLKINNIDNELNVENKKEYMKIVIMKINNEHNNKTNKEDGNNYDINIIIENEYIFRKNYQSLDAYLKKKIYS